MAEWGFQQNQRFVIQNQPNQQYQEFVVQNINANAANQQWVNIQQVVQAPPPVVGPFVVPAVVTTVTDIVIDEAATEKAYELFLEHLTPFQRDCVTNHSLLPVTASDGRKYVFDVMHLLPHFPVYHAAYRYSLVDCSYDYVHRGVLCRQQNGPGFSLAFYPVWDSTLAAMIMLQEDVALFESIACSYPVDEEKRALLDKATQLGLFDDQLRLC